MISIPECVYIKCKNLWSEPWLQNSLEIIQRQNILVLQSLLRNCLAADIIDFQLCHFLRNKNSYFLLILFLLTGFLMFLISWQKINSTLSSSVITHFSSNILCKFMIKILNCPIPAISSWSCYMFCTSRILYCHICFVLYILWTLIIYIGIDISIGVYAWTPCICPRKHMYNILDKLKVCVFF